MSQESDFVTYTHPSGIFSVDIPSSWHVRDDSSPGFAVLSLLSPDTQIFVRVAVNAAPEEDSDEAWEQMLHAFVSGTAGSETNFEMDEIEEDDDETLAVSYYYELNEVAYAGDAYGWYDEPYAVLFLAAMPEDRWEQDEETVDEIADSLAVDPAVSLS